MLFAGLYNIHGLPVPPSPEQDGTPLFCSVLHCSLPYNVQYSCNVQHTGSPQTCYSAGMEGNFEQTPVFCVKCLDKHGVMQGGLRLAERLVCQRSPPIRGRRSGLLHERRAPSSGQPPYYSVAIHVKTLLAGLGGSQYRSVQQPAVQTVGHSRAGRAVQE